MVDVVVIGAGIFGLSVAYALNRAGRSVQVFDAGPVGGGASGGVVGALCPHAPTKWRPFKQFQLDALLSLEPRIAEIEAQTGLSCGYRRLGRVTPLMTDRQRARADAEAEGARTLWGTAAAFDVLDQIPNGWQNWLDPAACPAGVVHETLSARVDPRAYTAALAAPLGAAVQPDTRVTRVLGPGKGIETNHGTVGADHIVIAAGWQSKVLIEPLQTGLGGQPVMGQAAVLWADAGPVPLLYADGLYAIPHGPGRVAVGSTSEKAFDGEEPDTQLDEIIASARAAVPLLREASVVERWAGLRPKPPGREPVIGPLPQRPDVWLATGGFKISFGIAHAVGDAVAAGLNGTEAAIPVPATFAPGFVINQMR